MGSARKKCVKQKRCGSCQLPGNESLHVVGTCHPGLRVDGNESRAWFPRAGVTGVLYRHRFRTAATSVRGDAYTVGKASCRTGLSSTSARSMRSNHRHAGAHKRVTVSPKVTPYTWTVHSTPAQTDRTCATAKKGRLV